MAPRKRFPLWLKIAYTAFLCVLVPVYWYSYGPMNFLFFCDLSLFFTLAALWLDSPVLTSMPALLIILPQTLWVADFLAELVGLPPVSLFGLTFPLGLTSYMFNPGISLFTRALSLFHGWLPFLLLWMVWYMGYDRRAFLPQLLLTWAVLVVCYLFTPPSPIPLDNPNAVYNINYVFALPNATVPQTFMPPLAYLALLMAFFAVCILIPTHFLLTALFPRRQPADIQVGVTNVSLPAFPPGGAGPQAAEGAETGVKRPEGTTGSSETRTNPQA